jgi:hypothetical protein
MHCVVADALWIEPVSTPKFPANREINREFCGFWRLAAILTPNRRAGSMVYNQIPYATEQGIFKRVSGKFFKEQGILTRDTSILNFEQPQADSTDAAAVAALLGGLAPEPMVTDNGSCDTRTCLIRSDLSWIS